MELENSTEKRRQRSARRLRHEAQIKVFQDQTGSLDGIRRQLGLRPSQICELLKVHPSAWTRWTRRNQAPPHVFQMLEWYMELLQWRGQHHPIQEKVAISKVVSQEDPNTYLPQGSSANEIKTAKVDQPRQLIKILIAVWFLQTILWCIVIGVLLKGRGFVFHL